MNGMSDGIRSDGIPGAGDDLPAGVPGDPGERPVRSAAASPTFIKIDDIVLWSDKYPHKDVWKRAGVGDGYITYTPATNVLTLHNAEIVQDEGDAAIEADGDLTIVLEGSNFINGNVRVSDITICGNGSLDSGPAYAGSIDIEGRNVTIDGVVVRIDSGWVEAENKLTIQNGAQIIMNTARTGSNELDGDSIIIEASRITMEGGSCCIRGSDGGVSISDSQISMVGDYARIDSGYSTSITSSTVSISGGSEPYSSYISCDSILNIKDSMVDNNGPSGCLGGDVIMICGSTVTATYLKVSNHDLTIDDSTVTSSEMKSWGSIYIHNSTVTVGSTVAMSDKTYVFNAHRGGINISSYSGASTVIVSAMSDEVSDVTAAPDTDGYVEIKAGHNKESAEAVEGSPFDKEVIIPSYSSILDNNYVYIHTYTADSETPGAAIGS